MISESLFFLATEINKFRNQKLGVTTDPGLKIGNTAKASEEDGLGNKIILSLINVEEDNAAKIRENT